jgi:hypothetical protein
MVGVADRMRWPVGTAIDAMAVSRVLAVARPGVRGAALFEAEPGADAGPAPRAPP